MKNRSLRAQRFVPVLSVLSLAMAASVQAQEIEINPVVVSASRLEQPLSTVLPSVSVITREDIERSQSTSLPDLLQGQAGFEFGRNGGPGAVTSFFLRGQESVNVVLMIDGLRVQTDSIGALQITDLPLEQVERIEILRGNASALYGEAAIGGVIQVFTKQGKGAPKAYGSVSAGSYGTRSVQLGYAGQAGDWRYDLNASDARSDGFSAINTQLKPTANPDRDGYSKQALFASAEKKLDADTRLGVRLSSRTSWADYDDASWGSLSTDTHRFQQTHSALGAYLKKAWSSQFATTVDASAGELKYEDLKNGVPFTAGDGSYKNGLMQGHQSVLRVSNELAVTPGGVLSFGAEYNNERFDAQGDNAYNMKRLTQAGFAGWSQRWSQWSAQLNVRHDDVAVDQANAWSSNTNHSSVNTGLAGLGYQLAPAWRMTATASTGFRAPTAYDVSSNPNIKAENHKAAELGLVYSNQATMARAVYFETRSTDAIGFDSNYNTVNIGKTRNSGLELTLQTQWMGTNLSLSAVSQDPWSETYSELLARRAKNYASADVSRDLAGYRVGVKLYAAGQRKDSHYSSVMMPGYSTAALYVSRKIDDNWTARARLENVFDKQYQLAYGYNTPGRGLYLTLQYSPK
ncbi:MAG: Vitamin transporter BtuB precursor [Pseudomonadota bacterium]|jgi:vitamin B12 transporter